MKNNTIDPKRGLPRGERARRLDKVGPNVLDTKGGRPPGVLLLSQFGDILVLILLAATLVSAVLGETDDAITILIIVILNAILGFIQEYKAERSLQALQQMASPKARILCEGEICEVEARTLVPGDVVILQAGDKVPADMTLFSTDGMEIEESPLTGESEPVEKSEHGGETERQALRGCLVTRGKGRGIVAATGMNTRMGHIARMIQQARPAPTPLQRRLNRLGKLLVVLCVIISAVVTIAGLLRGEDLYKMFMAGVSLAVAAIPEGLPAVVTLCLAIGVQRMLRRQAIVRKLPAVETLGCATIICSDKTGTLTENQMMVERALVGGAEISATGRGFELQGEIVSATAPTAELKRFLTVGALCNAARLETVRQRTKVVGDPTDGAMLVLAYKGGEESSQLHCRYEICAEYPFDSRRKMMTVVARDLTEGGYLTMVKGAPEVVISLCSQVAWQGEIVPISDGIKKQVWAVGSRWAQKACRLLAVAWKHTAAVPPTQIAAESSLTFSGLAAIKDPPRPEVAGAVAEALAAGIRPVMVTGDYRETAMAIARQVGLPLAEGSVLTGEELDCMSDRELARVVKQVSVCARVYPEHKLRLVKALKAQGNVVAMTGDGVNDAPAVKEADIGVAMGVAGTDVTKEAASLVLLDDNFATIVAAVREGRVIYDNIRKFIRFLLSCNAGEVFTVFLAMMVGFPLPLRAIQILYVNLVTDGLPALALSMEPAGRNIMRRPPRPVQENILAGNMGAEIFLIGLVIGVLTLAVFAWSLARGESLEYARTMAFSTLICIQLLLALSCRTEEGEQPPLGSNMWLGCALAISYCLLLIVLYNPWLQGIFSTVALTASDWFLVLAVSVLPLVGKKIAHLVQKALDL